jgi:O-antigen ligase
MIILILIFARPFICSLAFPYLNIIYSSLLIGFLCIWLVAKGFPFTAIKPVKYPLILFSLTLLISFIFSKDKVASFNEFYKYISALLLFIFAASLETKERAILIYTIIWAGIIISISAIYQYFFGFQHTLNYAIKTNAAGLFTLDYLENKRVFFPFVTPNILAGYLIMLIPLTFISKNRFWLIVPLCIALLLTKSLGAIFSLFLAMLLYIYLKNDSGKRKLLFAGGLMAVLILVFILRQTAAKEYVLPQFSFIRRMAYWQDAIIMIKTFFFTGIGLGNFNTPFSRYAHNSYLQIWAEMGILGIVSFLWLVIVKFKSGMREIKNSANKTQISALITASCAFLFHNFMDFTFFLPEVSLIWWVILGLFFKRNIITNVDSAKTVA